MDKQKRVFVLDCVNSKSSRLKPYNCKSDIHLYNFFACKSMTKRKTAVSHKALFPSVKSKKLPKFLEDSKPSSSLPTLKSQRSQTHAIPLSHNDLQMLIQKYRLKK